MFESVASMAAADELVTGVIIRITGRPEACALVAAAISPAVVSASTVADEINFFSGFTC